MSRTCERRVTTCLLLKLSVEATLES